MSTIFGLHIMTPANTLRKTAAGVVRAFRRDLARQRTIVPGDRILAACSGGPDSMALLSLLIRLRDEMPIEIVVAHFNHGLRPGAAADEDFVRRAARRLVLPFVKNSADVRAYAARHGLNLEEAGRILRYRFLQGTARRLGATKIATGHTMNDQAETFLMRLMRGTGLGGLAGIAPIQANGPCPVIRPLLGVTRPGILAYLEAENMTFRTDETNLDRHNLRNRVRLDLLPELERNYEPRIVEHLARLASIVREEDELLGEFSRELSEAFIVSKGAEIYLDMRTLPSLPPALARRVLREFIRAVKGDLRAISFEDVESVLGLGDGKERPLPGGLILRRERGWLGVKGTRLSPRSYRRLWDGQTRMALEASGMAFEGRRGKPGRRASLKGSDLERAALDASKLVFPLLVRNRRPGDLYRPLGAPGRKKLKEILRAKGVPAGARDRLPVFISGGEIVWVPGLPVAEKFKVTDQTKAVFVIEKK